MLKQSDMNDRPRPPRNTLLAWPTASLRAYLVGVILLATLPLAGLMVYQIFAAVTNQLERMQDNTLRSIKVLAQSVNRELGSTIDALRILSYSETLQRGEVDRFEHALRTRPVLSPSWGGIYLVSLAGEVIFDTAPPGPTSYPKDRNMAELWSRPNDKQALISDLLGGADGTSFVTAVEVPVTVDGVPLYLLGARIPISVWQHMVEGAGIGPQGVVSIFDGNNRVIARNHNPELYVGELRPAYNVNLINGRPSGSGRFTMFDGAYSYSAWDTVPWSGWGLGVGMPAAPIDAANNRAITLALGTAAACLLLGLILALTVARKMTRPLEQLSHDKIPPPSEHIAVQEISLLRDSLLASEAQSQAAQARLKFKRDLLQQQANEFETLFASSPIGLAFAQDRHCRVVTHNRAMDRLFGSTESQATGLVSVLDRGRQLTREEQPLERAAALGETTQDLELELLVDGRAPTFVIVNAVPLLDTDKKPRGAIGAVVDITARKAAEARLINAEQRLRESQHLVDLAQEVGHVGFFHYQFEADVLNCTPGLSKLFGLADDEGYKPLVEWTRCINRSDWRQVLRRLRNAFKNRLETETLSYSVIMPNGSACWLSTRVQMIYVKDGWPQHMIGIAVDMTEQKEAERERSALIAREQAARVDAEAANHAKDVFLAMLGHELRNPLSAITAAIEVLNRIGPTTEPETNARQILSRQTRHLARMMDDLLDVARVISGQVNLTCHRLDLAAKVQRVLDALEITVQPNQHHLILDLQEVWIDADATRIEQIVNNLVINAIKYTPQGGHIQIRVAADNDDALLEVSNTPAVAGDHRSARLGGHADVRQRLPACAP